MAFLGNDDARAERILDHRFLVRIAILARAAVKKFAGIHVFAHRNFLGGLDTDHGRHHAAHQCPPLAVQVLKGAHIFGVNSRRCCGQGVFFGRDAREQVQAAMLEAVIVERGNPGADQQNEDEKFD